jgi:photosystem II stability/assembly factor-like uncharacterized protein
MGTAVAIGTSKGALILRQDEPGGAWRSGGLALRGWIVTAFTRDPAGRAYAAVTHDVYGAAILASDDLAEWTQLEGAPRYAEGERGCEGHNRIISAMDPMNRFEPGARYVDQIWKLVAAGDVLYAGVSEAGLFRSDDRGKSWQVLQGLNRHPDRESWGPGFGGLCAHTVLVDDVRPERLWVGISAAGAFRSDDGGETFVSKNEGVSFSGEGYCVHSMAHDPRNADVIYRQDHRGVYRTSDGGDSWQLIEQGLPMGRLSDEHECSFGFAVGFDPRSGAAFLVPMEGDSFRYPRDGRLAVYRSEDRGESWQAFDEGLPRDCYANVLRGAMAVDGGDPCGVFFGTTSGGVYGSENGGESWLRLASELPRVLCVEAFEL